ncbi:unnamed protein product [Rotaria socialis]
MDFEKISSFTIDRPSTDKEKGNDIPIWLHLRNEQFQELFRKIFSSISTTTISIEELQQLAITMYQERKRLQLLIKLTRQDAYARRFRLDLTAAADISD